MSDLANDVAKARRIEAAVLEAKSAIGSAAEEVKGRLRGYVSEVSLENVIFSTIRLGELKVRQSFGQQVADEILACEVLLKQYEPIPSLVLYDSVKFVSGVVRDILEGLVGAAISALIPWAKINK
jgi:hypothetical protein